MATNQYMTGRKKYQRPQAILFSENPGTLQNGLYTPLGYEIDSDQSSVTDAALLDQFIVLSDDNRQPLDFSQTRIEKRERMINGRMRSYHIADKKTLSVSWQMLPSRAFSTTSDINITTGKSPNVSSGNPNLADTSYTTDGGAGGVEIKDWYDNHQGSFWVFLAYDNYSNFGKTDEDFRKLNRYNEVIEMFISNFTYSVVKRGSNNYDLWNISMTLEEA